MYSTADFLYCTIMCHIQAFDGRDHLHGHSRSVHSYHSTVQGQDTLHYVKRTRDIDEASSSSSKKRNIAILQHSLSNACHRAQINSRHELTCDLCKYPDPIIFIPECGHIFHSRCVGIWPMVTCPYCHGDVNKVAMVEVNMGSKPPQRRGIWTKQEEKFVDMIVDEFDHGTFPLANGTPLRLLLAKLLNCSTMRLSKKFQKNALGKRTYRVPKKSNHGFCISFDPESHQARQIEFSALEQAFRKEVSSSPRKESDKELRDLRIAVVQFWVQMFLKFAMSVGQPVDGVDASDPTKQKQAIQKLRDGQFEQLFHFVSRDAPERALRHMQPAPNNSKNVNSHHHQRNGDSENFRNAETFLYSHDNDTQNERQQYKAVESNLMTYNLYLEKKKQPTESHTKRNITDKHNNVAENIFFHDSHEILTTSMCSSQPVPASFVEESVDGILALNTTSFSSLNCQGRILQASLMPHPIHNTDCFERQNPQEASCWDPILDDFICIL